MKVTANVLMNYIRCRRYASLNDPNVEYISDEFEITSKNVFREYLDLFAKLYLDTEYQDKNMTLTYDFHNLVTLSENYHFIKEN
jgi:hypothetical protein